MACRGRPGERLYQSYDILCLLGQGAFATVVKALHRRENKCYAVKIFSDNGLRRLLSATHFGGSEQEMEVMAAHLRREVEFLHGLHHPYVCGLKEAFFEGYNVSVVLDLAKGGDLLSYVLKRDVLFELEGQYFTYQICEGLKYIHNQGIAHRNLKPENVLLTEDAPPMVKLADYGIVNVIESLSDLHTTSGTPAFVVPVVLDDTSKGYEKMVDSWSLGAMLFMLLTTATPFTNSSNEPNWYLLDNYNISGIGVDFIRCLLQFTPSARMTPAQALRHPWIVEQGRKQRARLIQREESFLRDAARRQMWLSVEECGREPLSKECEAESLTTKSTGDEDYVATKCTRSERHAAQPPPSFATFDLNSDEIPGLGQSHG